MMKIDTTTFGEIDIPQDKIINMPVGILGFSCSKRFVMIEKEETYPFYWLQSVDEPFLALAIMNPFLFEPNYSLNLASIFEIMAWDENEEENIDIYVVINAAESLPEYITANLQAPIIINTKRGEAVQMVVHDSLYSHQHVIFGK